MSLRTAFILMLFIATSSHASTNELADENPYITLARVGLADEENHKIFSVGEITPYQENGVCLIGSNIEPCMRWGISFNFGHMEPSKEMKCTLTSSRPAKEVGALYDSKNDTTVNQRFEVSFEHKSGYMFIPMGGIKREPSDADIVAFKTTCEINGRELMNLNFLVNFQPKESKPLMPYLNRSKKSSQPTPYRGG